MRIAYKFKNFTGIVDIQEIMLDTDERYIYVVDMKGEQAKIRFKMAVTDTVEIIKTNALGSGYMDLTGKRTELWNERKQKYLTEEEVN